MSWMSTPKSEVDEAPVIDRSELHTPLGVEISSVSHVMGEGDRRRQILTDITLSFRAGEIVIITGPSGAGKTTLLTLVGAIRSLQEGSLRIMGRELKGLSQKELQKTRKEIGFIFQAHNLFESLTALQTLELAMRLHPHSSDDLKTRPRMILTELGLAERLHSKPGNLSEGQKQRVAIGRALINHPRLILADEPTAALDRDTGRQVVNLLRRRSQEEHCTILIVTHDERIHDVADRIVNLVDGSVDFDRVMSP